MRSQVNSPICQFPCIDIEIMFYIPHAELGVTYGIQFENNICALAGNIIFWKVIKLLSQSLNITG